MVLSAVTMLSYGRVEEELHELFHMHHFVHFSKLLGYLHVAITSCLQLKCQEISYGEEFSTEYVSVGLHYIAYELPCNY